MADKFQIFLTSYLTGSIMRVEANARAGEMKIAQDLRLGGQALAMTIASGGRNLHVAILEGSAKDSAPHYATLAIDPESGALTHRATRPAPAYTVHMSTDRSGGWLLGASEPSGRISVTRIAPDGLPEAAPAQIIENLARPHHILTDRTNRHCYVPCMGTDDIHQFTFDAVSGTLRPASQQMLTLPEGSGPRHMAHHPVLDRAWLVTQHDGKVVTCSLDPDSGALQQLAVDSLMPDGFQGRARGAQIHVAPDGKHLFVTERTHAALISWRIDQTTGRLSDRQSIPCPTGVRCFHISPNGKFLVVSGVDSDRARAPEDTPDIACFPVDPGTCGFGQPDVLKCMDGIYWVEILQP